MLKIAVITISDRAHRGDYSDRSGPAVTEVLRQAFPDCMLETEIVPDEMERIRHAICDHDGCDWIITTGGTGISPRDVTPEATRLSCEREIPGVSEWLRRESEKETLNAVFSRGYCGIRGNAIVVNLPGSIKGASFCTRLLAKIMEHGLSMLRGNGH